MGITIRNISSREFKNLITALEGDNLDLMCERVYDTLVQCENTGEVEVKFEHDVDWVRGQMMKALRKKEPNVNGDRKYALDLVLKGVFNRISGGVPSNKGVTSEEVVAQIDKWEGTIMDIEEFELLVQRFFYEGCHGGDLEEIFEELERIGADDKVLKRIKVLEDSKLEHPGVKIMRKVVEGCMPL